MQPDESFAPPARASNVVFTKKTLTVSLTDGRAIIIPLEWYPRLLHATNAERSNWRLTSEGEGIYWSELDEEVSVENLVRGKESSESFHSLKRWLANRAKHH